MRAPRGPPKKGRKLKTAVRCPLHRGGCDGRRGGACEAEPGKGETVMARIPGVSAICAAFLAMGLAPAQDSGGPPPGPPGHHPHHRPPPPPPPPLKDFDTN